MGKIADRLAAKVARRKPKDSEFLQKARARFKLANEADAAQCERERDDIAFEDGDQWSEDLKRFRSAQSAKDGMPAVPERPTIVINKIKEPIRQILNQERAADLGVEIVAADDFGDLGVVIDESEIRLREGLVRRIQRESHASDARTWAFKRGLIGGRGFYLVSVRYLPGKTRDQEVYVHRIYEQSGVKLDPAHENPDGSDADWEFIGTWVPWDRYIAENPDIEGKKNPYVGYSDADFVGLTEEMPDWYRSTTDSTKTSRTKDAKASDRAVRVVNYWYVDRVAHDLCTLSDGTYCWIEELPAGVEPIETDTVVERTIKYCKLGGGMQILDGENGEGRPWAGPDMPIVKYLGDEVLPYDNQRRSEGMVRPSRDAAMGENYLISKLVETIGLTPLSPLQVDPEAIDGYEEWYKVANIRPLPYLPSRTYDDQGRPLKEPHRPAVDPNIFPMAQAINLFDQFIRSTTAVPDPTLGNVDPSLKSGKAIRELTGNAAQSTSNFLDNLARSIAYEAQIINNLLYPIYGAKPGRIVRILTGDGEAKTMRIGDPSQAQQIPGHPPQPGAHPIATLTKDAHFNVMAKVTKNFDSRRAEEATTLGNLITAEPSLMTWFGDLFFKNTDGPGHIEMADRAKLMLAPQIQSALAAQQQGQAPIPPQVQQKLQQQEQLLQQAQQIITKLSEEAKGHQLDYQGKIDTEKIRQDANVKLAQIDADRTIQLQAMKDATTISAARIAAKQAADTADQEAMDEQIALGHQHAQDSQQAALDRQHEQGMASAQMAHDAASQMSQQDAQAQQQAQQAQQDGQAGQGQ